MKTKKIESRGRNPKNPEGNRLPWTGRLDPQSHIILQTCSDISLSQAEIVDSALLIWHRKRKKP